MAKKVERWQSKDGQLWETEKEAKAQDTFIELGNDFSEICGNVEGCKIYFGDFWDWAQENSFFLRDLVKYMHQKGYYGK